MAAATVPAGPAPITNTSIFSVLMISINDYNSFVLILFIDLINTFAKILNNRLADLFKNQFLLSGKSK
jgi:hypothetical protein